MTRQSTVVYTIVNIYYTNITSWSAQETTYRTKSIVRTSSEIVNACDRARANIIDELGTDQCVVILLAARVLSKL